jgi:hypothetical protein
MDEKEQCRPADEWPRPTLEWIIGQLTKLLERGAFSTVLRKDAPELVELLCPRNADSAMNDKEQGDEAERKIRKAIEAVGKDYHENVEESLLCCYALKAGFCLKGGSLVRNDQTARKKRLLYAAEAVGLTATRTFKSKYLPQYIEELARKLRDDMVA